MSYKNNSLQRDKKMTYNDVCRVAQIASLNATETSCLDVTLGSYFQRKLDFLRALLKLCTLVSEKVGNFGYTYIETSHRLLAPALISM